VVEIMDKEAGFVPTLRWVRSLDSLRVIFEKFNWVWVFITSFLTVTLANILHRIAKDETQRRLGITRQTVQLIPKAFDVVH